MKREEINVLYDLYDQFEKEAYHVFDVFNKMGLLDFYNNEIEKIHIDKSLKDVVEISYIDSGYDLYDYSILIFPSEILGDDDKIAKYAAEYKEDLVRKQKEEEEERLKAKEESERKQYEELKRKFESK